MEDDLYLEAALGFRVEGQVIMRDRQVIRDATRVEVALWTLLVTPQKNWSDTHMPDIYRDI